jgi:hypothetical protein
MSNGMRAALLLIVLASALAVAVPAAGAASVAYIDGGEVWLSSLDGGRKVRLAAPVVNGEGKTEKWLAVAASDGGRIVAARNVPGRISNFTWFKVWEPDGSSTVEGPLNAPSGWTLYVYPLGFDVTPDGRHMVYGYSNSGSCCPISFARGTYVRPVTNSLLQPINISGYEEPTLFGSRVIAKTGATINVQEAAATTYGTDFTPWLDTSGTGLDLRRTDVAANGQRAALELEQWDNGTQTIGKIAVLAIQGVDQPPAFPLAVDCFLPASGVAKEVSLSADAKTIAWTDARGLVVAGAPVDASDPCVLASPPVVLSPTASQAAIGGADVSAFLPASPPGTPPAGSPSGGGSPPPGATTRPAAPRAILPGKVTTKALGAARGLAVKVRVAAAGKVELVATVPAARMGRKGKPVVIARGSKNAARAGTVKIRLRLTAAARKRLKRLKGARMTVRITQGGRSSSRKVTLR